MELVKQYLLIILIAQLFGLYSWNIAKASLAVWYYQEYDFAILICFTASSVFFCKTIYTLAGYSAGINLSIVDWVAIILTFPYFVCMEALSACTFYRGRDLLDPNGIFLTTLIIITTAMIRALW